MSGFKEKNYQRNSDEHPASVGISLFELVRMFPDDATAEAWFARQRWGEEPWCPRCGSTSVRANEASELMPYRCQFCQKPFNVRTMTTMAGTKLGYQTWVIAIHLLTEGLRSVTPTRLHCVLGVSRETARRLVRTIQAASARPSAGRAHNAKREGRSKHGCFGGKKGLEHKQTNRSDEVDGIRQFPIDIYVGATSSGMTTRSGPIEPDSVKQEIELGLDDQRTRKLSNKLSYQTDEHTRLVISNINSVFHNRAMESFWLKFKQGYCGTSRWKGSKMLDQFTVVYSG